MLDFPYKIEENEAKAKRIINELNGMSYGEAVFMLETCKKMLGLAIIRANEIMPDDTEDFVQTYLDEKARQEGDGE